MSEYIGNVEVICLEEIDSNVQRQQSLEAPAPVLRNPSSDQPSLERDYHWQLEETSQILGSFPQRPSAPQRFAEEASHGSQHHIDLDLGLGSGSAARSQVLSRRKVPPKNPCSLDEFMINLNSYHHKGMQLEAGSEVELADESFFRISKLSQDPGNDNVFLRGQHFIRARNLNGLLEKKSNELVLILNADSERQMKAVADVIRIQRIIVTNRPHPAHNNGVAMICRWKASNVFRVCESKSHDSSLIQISENEADQGYSVPDKVLKLQWRDCTTQPPVVDLTKKTSISSQFHGLGLASSIPRQWSVQRWIGGGGYLPQIRPRKRPARNPLSNPRVRSDRELERPLSVDGFHCLDDDDEGEPSGKIDRLWNRTNRPLSIISPEQYTLGDGFSGCGGTSRGAIMAGFRIPWCFDHDLKACESHRKSFPHTRIAHTTAFEFTTNPIYGGQVDVLHLSPPCQFFSPAHTVNGPNDENNVDSSFVILEMIKKIKPRIVTLENTAGLKERHPDYLVPFLQQFTANGYSVRWQVLNLADYGVPQSRRRLVLLASCPGEALPTFPPPTHSPNPTATSGLLAYTTIASSISSIPRHYANHQPDDPTRRFTRRPAYDAHRPAKTITTGGGIGNYHPSGLRAFTVREMACLQTFPLEHVFGDDQGVTVLKRQIGNAVPPRFASALFAHVRQALMRADGRGDVLASEEASVRGRVFARGVDIYRSLALKKVAKSSIVGTIDLTDTDDGES